MSGITAPRAYYPGDLIYSEEAYVLSPPLGDDGTRCSRCSKRAAVPIPCNKCSDAQYCGTECQAKDAEDHKLECGQLNIPLITEHDHYHLMIARIILRVKGKDWKSITKNVMGTDVSFDDLDSRYEEMIKHPKFLFLCEEMEVDLIESLGEENIPEKDDLMKIIGKVRHNNNFAITSQTPLRFYFGYDRFKNECIPNAYCDTYDNVMNIWALKKIEASEQITIAKHSFLCYAPDEMGIISSSRCTDCSLPYGKSILTKILDERKAYRVIKLSEDVVEMLGVLFELDADNDFIRVLKPLIVGALEQQEGVLGPTNILHLKLSSLRGMVFDADEETEKWLSLMDSAKKTSAVFGEYYPRLTETYRELCMYSYSMGNITTAHEYENKIQIMSKYRKPPSENLSREPNQEQTSVKSLEEKLLNL